eukprot:scaffold68200_cov63-Phaeocystis_antarctica.AAC.3
MKRCVCDGLVGGAVRSAYDGMSNPRAQAGPVPSITASVGAAWLNELGGRGEMSVLSLSASLNVGVIQLRD